MEEIRKHLTDILTASLRAHDAQKAQTIRGLLSSIHNEEIEAKRKGEELSDKHIISLLKRELKKRHESAEMFEKGGADQRAEEEKKEASFIKTLLPPQLSRDEIEVVVEKVMAQYPDATVKDMGRIIKSVIEEAGEGADGKMVSEIVKEKLS